MKPILTYTALALLLTACNPMNLAQSDLNLHQTIAPTEAHLTGQWRLMPQNGQTPLVLQFANGQVAVLNGCNNLSAAYQIDNGQVHISPIRATRMMCEPALMQIDQLASQLLKGRIQLQRFVDALPHQIHMSIESNGQKYQLIPLR